MAPGHRDSGETVVALRSAPAAPSARPEVSAGPAIPAFRLGAGSRLAFAGIAIAVLWAVVFWALG